MKIALLIGSLVFSASMLPAQQLLVRDATEVKPGDRTANKPLDWFERMVVPNQVVEFLTTVRGQNAIRVVIDRAFPKDGVWEWEEQHYSDRYYTDASHRPVNEPIFAGKLDRPAKYRITVYSSRTGTNDYQLLTYAVINYDDFREVSWHFEDWVPFVASDKDFRDVSIIMRLKQ